MAAVGLVDWDDLRQLAISAMSHAYCPYSGYPVGAAGLTDTGALVSGCNVENSSLGVGLCAECGMVSQLVREGAGKLVAVICVNGDEDVVSPCGRCRQLIADHAAPGAQIQMPSGVMTVAQMLPDFFGPTDLAAVSTSTYKPSSREGE
ncbi:MAG: cytidine deaminase [Actinomycetaceae bacterium]|nr:cytidine deaminase [Actinomycetaceae bacterium]